MNVVITELLVGSILEQLQAGRAAPSTLQLRHPFTSQVAQFGLQAAQSPSIMFVVVPAALLVLKGFKKNPARHAWAIVGVVKFTARHLS